MGRISKQTTDGIQYVPKDIQNLLNDYQANPDDLSARQAIFSKLYNGGGDQQRLAVSLANSDNAQGYDGLRSQLITAYTPQDAQLRAQQRLIGAKQRNNNNVPNLSAVDGTGQAQAVSSTPQAGGVYQNLPQNSALLFLKDRDNQ
jgi:hypothetical protein